MQELKIIVNALNVANKNGAFNLEESATIVNAISEVEKQLNKCSTCCQNDKDTCGSQTD